MALQYEGKQMRSVESTVFAIPACTRTSALRIVPWLSGTYAPGMRRVRAGLYRCPSRSPPFVPVSGLPLYDGDRVHGDHGGFPHRVCRICAAKNGSASILFPTSVMCRQVLQNRCAVAMPARRREDVSGKTHIEEGHCPTSRIWAGCAHIHFWIFSHVCTVHCGVCHGSPATAPPIFSALCCKAGGAKPAS